MSWRRKEPGHQQPWYFLCWAELIRSPHVKGQTRIWVHSPSESLDNGQIKYLEIKCVTSFRVIYFSNIDGIYSPFAQDEKCDKLDVGNVGYIRTRGLFLSCDYPQKILDIVFVLHPYFVLDCLMPSFFNGFHNAVVWFIFTMVNGLTIVMKSLSSAKWGRGSFSSGPHLLIELCLLLGSVSTTSSFMFITGVDNGMYAIYLRMYILYHGFVVFIMTLKIRSANS